MNVKDSLRNCLMLYPGIFPNRWAVYHHWFAVNGNGYDWVDGELVSWDEEKVHTKEDAVEYFFKDTLEDILNSSIKWTIKNLKKSILSLLRVEEREQDFTPKEKIYPLCQYACLLNIPDDIKPDWKEAALEFYNSLSQIDLSSEDKQWLKKVNPILFT